MSMRFWLFSVGCDRLLLADCSLLRRAENGQERPFRLSNKLGAIQCMAKLPIGYKAVKITLVQLAQTKSFAIYAPAAVTSVRRRSMIARRPDLLRQGAVRLKVDRCISR